MERIIDVENTVFWVCCAALIMWFQFIYWFRLFEFSTLYVRLITQTLKDMKWFFLIFVMVTMCFANTIYILNLNRMQESNGEELYDETFPSYAYVNALLNQYMVTLGEYSTDNYSLTRSAFATKNDSYIVWMLFIFTTVFSQIVIFNILIAIMGDTYDFVFSNLEKAILKNKIEVMSDYVFFIKSEKNIERFLFVATLAEEGIETESPLGVKFAAIKGIIEKNLENMKEMVIRKFSQAHSNLDEKLDKQVGGLKENLGGLKENLGGLRENLSGLKEDLYTRDAKLETIEKSIASIEEKVCAKDTERTEKIKVDADSLAKQEYIRAGGLEARVGGLEDKVGGLEVKVGGLQDDVQEMKGDVQGMKGLLEQLLQKLASD